MSYIKIEEVKFLEKDNRSKNYFEIELNIKDPFKDKQPCWMHFKEE